MKITFLTPPALKNSKAPERIFGCNYGIYFQPNIFILYPAAMLEKHGYEVKFIDCPIEKLSWNWLTDFLKKDDSDIYVLYTVFLAVKIDIKASKLIRKLRKDSYIIFLGPEPTSRPQDFIFDEKTFVVRGETEHTILELVNEINGKKRFRNVLGISWMRNRKIINNKSRPLIKNLDSLPFPARHLIKKELYFNPKLKGRPSTVMLTSRNCYGRCIYCIPCSYTFAREIEYRKHFGKKPPVGLRSPENIAEEFKLLKEQGYKSIAIIDDNFVNGKERTIKICKLIKPLKMEWGCLSRADALDEDIVKAMAEAGCKYVDLGAESFDQKVLDYVHKDIKIEQVFNAINLLKKYGIDPKINILFGVCPYETEESIKKTVEILKKLNLVWVNFSVCIPHREIEFYKIVKKNKWFATRSGDFEPVDPFRGATVNMPNLSSEDYKRLVRWAYREYFLRPTYIIKKLMDIKSFREFKENLKSARRLFF